MTIYPAIDLAKGRCVRLLQGDRNRETVYGESPAEVALEWQDRGATYLHIVDLDGAFEGRAKNTRAIRAIAKKVSIPIQLGGGIRTLESIRKRLDLGVERVILGTIAVENARLVKEALDSFGPEKIVIGIDAKDGFVSVRGWTHNANIAATELAEGMVRIGIRHFVYTDIARDGMLTGPNLPELQKFAKATGGAVIASGGIASLADVRAICDLGDIGIEGMITGKALYERKLSLEEALRVAAGKQDA